MSALFEVETPVAEPVASPAKLCTADMDALLCAKYSATAPGNGPRYIRAFEVRNRAGFSASRTADLLVMDTWESGPVRLIGHEVKVSRSDWLRELKQPEKAEAFIPHVAEWWLVVADRSIVKDGELPEGWGLMAATRAGLRTYVKAKRKPQPPIPTGMLAALLRTVEADGRALAARERRRPFGIGDCPRAPISDAVAPDFMVRRNGEVQAPRYDLRTRRPR